MKYPLPSPLTRLSFHASLPHLAPVSCAPMHDLLPTLSRRPRLAMAIKEGDKFPMDATFQIKGDAGPAVRGRSTQISMLLYPSPPIPFPPGRPSPQGQRFFSPCLQLETNVSWILWRREEQLCGNKPSQLGVTRPAVRPWPCMRPKVMGGAFSMARCGRISVGVVMYFWCGVIEQPRA